MPVKPCLFETGLRLVFGWAAAAFFGCVRALSKQQTDLTRHGFGCLTMSLFHPKKRNYLLNLIEECNILLRQMLRGEQGPDGKEAQLSEPDLTVVAPPRSILQTVFRLQHKQFWSSRACSSKHLLIQIYFHSLAEKTKAGLCPAECECCEKMQRIISDFGVILMRPSVCQLPLWSPDFAFTPVSTQT